MPLYKVGLTCQNTLTELNWTYRTNIVLADRVAVIAYINAFHEGIRLICSNVISVLFGTYEDEAGGEPTVELAPSVFAHSVGAVAADPIPDSCAALWQGFGSPTDKGRGDHLIHGIAETMFDPGGFFLVGGADVITAEGACNDFFTQFRPAMSPVHHYPIIAPPQPYAASRFHGSMFAKKLGRPVFLPGQTARSR